MKSYFSESLKYLSLGLISKTGLWLWRCGTIDSDARPAGDLCQLFISVRDETNYFFNPFFLKTCL